MLLKSDLNIQQTGLWSVTKKFYSLAMAPERPVEQSQSLRQCLSCRVNPSESDQQVNAFFGAIGVSMKLTHLSPVQS